MPSPALLLTLLMVTTFSLATWLDPRQSAWSNRRAGDADFLTLLLGDGRRLFANHFFIKADVYLHSGYYPSIFDQRPSGEKTHLAQATGSSPHEHNEQCDHDHEGDHHHDDHDAEHEREMAFLGRPKDWIDRFGRHFYPTRHTHLGGKGDEREMLPWLRISASLDPNQVETYTVASYWLRSRLGKVEDAEQFLRDGLRANPDSYVILLELGRLYHENKNDAVRARNVWELGLVRWQEQQAGNPAPDLFPLQQLLVHLARLEENEGNLRQAILHLEQLQRVAVHPKTIRTQIELLKEQIEKN